MNRRILNLRGGRTHTAPYPLGVVCAPTTFRFGVGLVLAGLCFLLLAAQSRPVAVRAAPAAAIKVMPLGDSITSGTNAGYNPELASYRCELYKALSKNVSGSYDVDFVGSVHGQWGINGRDLTPPSTYCNMYDWDEEGHSGWAIYNILAGDPGWSPSKLDDWAKAAVPDVVLIHLGTCNFINTNPAPNVNDAISQMGQVIDTLRAANPRVRILLAQILPARLNGTVLTLIPEFNARLVTLAASMTRPFSPIVLVDMYNGFNFDQHFVDGVHPNPDGENKMAVRWRAGFDTIMQLKDYWSYIPQTVK